MALDSETKAALTLGGLTLALVLVPSEAEIAALKGDIDGFLSHPGEDTALDAAAAADIWVRIQTLGLVDSTLAADFYSWLHNLSDEDRAKVEAAEKNGAVSQAAKKSVDDALGGLTYATRWALAAGCVAAVLYINVEG